MVALSRFTTADDMRLMPCTPPAGPGILKCDSFQSLLHLVQLPNCHVVNGFLAGFGKASEHQVPRVWRADAAIAFMTLLAVRCKAAQPRLLPRAAPALQPRLPAQVVLVQPPVVMRAPVAVVQVAAAPLPARALLNFEFPSAFLMEAARAGMPATEDNYKLLLSAPANVTDDRALANICFMNAGLQLVLSMPAVLDRLLNCDAVNVIRGHHMPRARDAVLRAIGTGNDAADLGLPCIIDASMIDCLAGAWSLMSCLFNHCQACCVLCLQHF